MNFDPRTSLIESLQAPPDETSAFVALGHAIVWATGSLRVVDSVDETAVFRHVGAVSDAFAHVDALIEALAPVVDSDVVGATVQRRLDRYGAKLEEAREQVARTSSNLAALREREADLHAAAAEQAEPNACCAELRRLTELAGKPPALRARTAELEPDVAAIHDEATEAEEGLWREASRIIRLTEEQRALLAPDLRRLVDEAARAETDLMAERARHGELAAVLAGRLADFERLRADHSRLPSLRAYAAAQRELVEGLARLDAADPSSASDEESDNKMAFARVAATIADVERRLADLDTVLKPVLERHAEAHEEARAMVTWVS
jgi:chromosome segregation ATPase